MTRNKLPTVLAIAPGTREFGVAVFRGLELVYFAVKRFKPSTSAQHLEKEVFVFWKEFSEYYNTNVLAYKEINQYQQTSQPLRFIVSSLKKHAAKKRVLIVEISLNQMRRWAGEGNGKFTQKLIFQKIAVLYPELEQFRTRPNKRQKNYYAYILSAVAAGLVCLQGLVKCQEKRDFRK
jgi:hypothetical protein